MNWRRFGERAIELLIRLCGVSAILFVFGIFVFVFGECKDFLFHRLDLKEFFTSIEWRPTNEPPTYGVFALILGTVAVTIVSMGLAVPFGVGTAVFVSEFCSRRTRETLKIVIE